MTRSQPLNTDELSWITHQLKNPLSAILGYAELLALRDDVETRQEAPRGISDAARALSRIIDDLVTLLAVDYGAPQLDLHPLDVEDLLGAVAEQARRTGVLESAVAVRSDEQPWPIVVGDPDYLSRALTSVLVAVGEVSRPDTEITIDVTTAGGYVEIAFAAAGTALDAGALERFATLGSDGLEARRGTGLELYTARKLAELHGGTVSIRSVNAIVLTVPYDSATQG